MFGVFALIVVFPKRRNVTSVPGDNPISCVSRGGMPNRDFLALLMEHQSALYAFICSLLGSAESSHDVLQETNLVLMEKASEYDPARPFRSWAFRFAHNQVMAFRLKLQRDRLVFSDQMLEQVHDRALEESEHVESALKALDKCMEKLPTRQRELIHRHYGEGLQLKEIAAGTSQSVNALAVMIFRARQAIIHCVKTRLAKEADA
jgi:RNA polymerase sigma-70 factor (ECF subfamily)